LPIAGIRLVQSSLKDAFEKKVESRTHVTPDWALLVTIALWKCVVGRILGLAWDKNINRSDSQQLSLLFSIAELFNRLVVGVFRHLRQRNGGHSMDPPAVVVGLFRWPQTDHLESRVGRSSTNQEKAQQ
jgi:hypothetical protein